MFSLNKGQNLSILCFQRTGGIQHHENQVCLFRIGFGFFHAHFFHYVPCFTDTCGVYDFDGDAVDVDIFLYGITGGAGNIRNDGAVLFQEPVQERRFAYVWFPNDNGLQAFPQDFASICPCQQFFHTGKEFLCPLLHGIVSFFFDVIVWIVNDSFDGSNHVDDFLTHLADFCFQSAFQLIHSRLTGQFCFGLNQVNDGFRLSQVDTSVEETTFCKFPRFCQSGASV